MLSLLLKAETKRLLNKSHCCDETNSSFLQRIDEQFVKDELRILNHAIDQDNESRAMVGKPAFHTSGSMDQHNCLMK